MALCDVRRYEPAECGTFKVRVSDGDLVWECAPAINRPNIAPVQFPINYLCPPVDDKIIVQGRFGSRPTVMEVTQADGLITSVDRTETITPAPDYVFSETGRLPLDVGANYIYGTTFGGYLHSTNETCFVLQFDRATKEHVGTITIGQSLSFGSAAWGYYMWACRVFGDDVDVWNWGGGSTAGARIIRWPAGDFWDTGAPLRRPYGGVIGDTAYIGSLTQVSCTPFMDRYFRIPSDGTYYYMSQNSPISVSFDALKIKKIRISDLTLVADSTTVVPAWVTDVEVRDGLIIFGYGLFSNFKLTVFDTGSLTQQYVVSLTPNTRRVTAMDVVTEFSTTIEVATASTTTLDIVCRDPAGTELWSVPITAIQSPTALLKQYQPKVLISQDKSKVYVWGSLKRGTQSVQLYCLDATNGDTLWSFAAVGMLQTLFTSSGSGGAGMMLHDDGDHVYLSVVSCFAPEYR